MVFVVMLFYGAVSVSVFLELAHKVRGQKRLFGEKGSPS